MEIERRGPAIERVVRGQERARRTAAGPLLLVLVALALVAGGSAPAAPATELSAEPAGGSASGDGAALLIRWIPTADLGIARPAGLAYVPRTKSLVVVGPAARRTKLLRLSVLEDVQGRSRVRTVARPSTVAFDPVKGRLAFLTRRALLPVAGTPKLRRTAARTASLAGLGLVSPRAMTFDRATKTWHILDAGARAIVRVSLSGGTLRPAGRTPLGALGRAGLRGIAFNPTDGLVYVLSPNRGVLFGLDRAGTVQSAYTLGDLGLRNPTAIVIAPSADPTDDPSAHHLYVSDAGSKSQRGGIVEARLEEPRRLAAAAASVDEVNPTVVQIIQTSLFSPSSPDPAGIAYNPTTDRLLISDSEVNETPTYQGFNLFTATRNGSGTGTGTTLAFSKEPTGLGYDPATATLYVGDDDADAVTVVRPGPDGRHGTSDDTWYKFSTGALGSTDTEGVEYDPASGHVYVCDGIALDIFDIDPVNGVFGDGNDVVTRFDIGQYGARDCEGMGIDPARDTLLALDPSSKKLYELTRAGALVRVINGGGIPTTNKALAGVTVAPTSDPNDHPSKTNYWIVDRQVDNGADPNENDGLLYELSVPTTSTEPAISVISPAEGALVAGTVVIEAASIGGVSFSRVDFHVDGVLVGTDTNGGDGWTTSWPTSGVSNGAHVVRATGTAVGGATAQDSNTVTVDNAPPAVAVTAPTAGSTVESTISVTAAASDNTTVASVQFFVDGASIGTDTSSAGGWSVAWNTTAVANGSHTITAVARDVPGNTATSAAVGVLVDNPAVVTVAVPVSTGNDDADELESGTVRRSTGDLELGSDGGIPTTVGVRFAGVNVPKGARIEEAYVQFQADEAGRDVASLTIRGQTADNAASFTTTAFNISSRPRTTASASWSPPQWVTVGEAGPNQRTPNLRSVVQEVVDRPGWAPGNALVVLFNGTGRRTPESFEGLAPPVLHVAYSAVGTGPPPDEPPQVAISSPSAGALLSGAVTLTATASDDLGVASVQFAVDGAPVGTDTNGADGWSMTWNATAAGGRVITATARDTGGQTTTSAPVSVIVDSPPSVALGSPAAGATVSGTVTVSASASDDNAVTAVSFSVDGTTIGTDTNGSDGWSVPWNTTQVPDGPHALAATATDTRGQTASDSRSVTVDNFDAPPSVSFTTPPPGALLAGTVLLAVAASDDRGIASVEFSSAGTVIGTDTNGSDGWSVSWDTTSVADGARTVTATAFDTRGQSTSASAGVTVDNSPPSVAVTAPSAGATVRGTVPVTATTSDDTTARKSDGMGDVAALDRFGRTVSPGSTWGTADVGGAWEWLQGTTTGWEVSDGVAKVTPGLKEATARLPVNLADVDLLGRVRWTDQAAGGVFNAGSLLARIGANAGDLYQAIIRVSHTNQRVALQIRRHLAGASSQLGSDFVLVPSGYTPGDWWWIRFQAIGTELKAKAWKHGTPEPGGWQLEVTDPSHASGGIGYKYSSSSGNTVAPVLEFGDLTAAEPAQPPADVGSSVEFFVDGASIGTDVNGADGWSVSWDATSVPNGNHTITAVARDAAGNSATSPGVAVTVDNPTLVTLAVPIAVGIDDADQLLDTGAIRRTNGDLELGSDGGIPTIVGLRFAGLGIPSGAVVEEAYVQFQTDENGKTAANLTVQAERADNAASFTTAAFGISSRPRTAASVAWSPPQWVGVGEAGPNQRTPDLRSVLQEVVSRPGWSAGNALVVLVTGTGRRTPESFEGGAPPVLHVSFTVPGS